MRIRGELLKLGVDVSSTTIAIVLRRSGLGPAPRRVGPTWAQFLRLQALAILRGDPRTDLGGWLEDLARDPIGSARDGKIPRPGDDDAPVPPEDEAACVAPRQVWDEEPTPHVQIARWHETVAASRQPMLGARSRDGPTMTARFHSSHRGRARAGGAILSARGQPAPSPRGSDRRLVATLGGAATAPRGNNQLYVAA